jgi:hypothetical protein
MFGLTPLVPAYGRDYKSKKAVEEDFYNNKDFKTPSGSYTNWTDLKKTGLTEIEIRYNKLMKLTFVKI